jgi:hypothetical protein
MQLYDHKIDDSCKHEQSWKDFDFELKDLPKNQQIYHKKLSASPFCSIKLWSYVDTTLHELLNSWKTFDSKMYYDLLIQIVYVIYLINKEGYVHNDFHGRNIGLKKQKKNI